MKSLDSIISSTIDGKLINAAIVYLNKLSMIIKSNYFGLIKCAYSYFIYMIQIIFKKK